MEEEHLMVLKTVPQPSQSEDDKFTFLVTIKPSPPPKRKVYNQPVDDIDEKPPQRENSPTKSFGQVLQDLIDQIAAPAEKELEEQISKSQQREELNSQYQLKNSQLKKDAWEESVQIVRQKQGVEHATPICQKHTVHYAQVIRPQANTPSINKWIDEPAPDSFHFEEFSDDEDINKIPDRKLSPSRSRWKNIFTRSNLQRHGSVPTFSTQKVDTARTPIHQETFPPPLAPFRQSFSSFPLKTSNISFGPRSASPVLSENCTVYQNNEMIKEHNNQISGTVSQSPNVPQRETSNSSGLYRRDYSPSQLKTKLNTGNRDPSPSRSPAVWSNNWHDGKGEQLLFNQKSNGTLPETEELHEKIRRLEGDKQTLSLQVSVLNEQIEAQNEKIRELESLLHKLRDRADRAEGMLQRDVLIRSSLESQKLDLMSELSSVKSRLSASEKDKFHLEDCLHKSESEAASLRRQLADKDETLSSLKNRQSKLSTPPETSPVTTESSLRRLQRRNHEMEKLKKALESVMSANEEKDRKIEELRAAMERYKRLQEKISNIHGGKQEEDNIDGSLLGLSSNSLQFNNFEKVLADKPPVVPRPSATSTPFHGKTESSSVLRLPSSGQASPAPSSIHGSTTSTPHKVGDYPPTVTSSEESINRPPKTPPSRNRLLIDHYGTVPRNYAPLLQSESSCTLPADTARSRPKTPFAQSESVPVIVSQSGTLPVGITAPGSAADGKHKNRGIRKIFGRLKRSNSQSLESDLPPEEFKRGGMRATAGARLGWSKELRGDKEKCTGSIESIGGIDVPFARWSGEKVAAWLHDMGLSTYIGDCKRWVANGDQLLKASSHDLEKELGIKNSLHRKKLQLALQAIGSDGQDELGGLDHHWVTRWLDDVGLPQYKDVFSEARIDGRMLHYLTVEDLTNLKVTNLLHVISLKRGIHVLRLNGFNPNCLKRRPAPNENNPALPSEVALWTNHRVMEWLRSVDLSEYAPNLRGSGVHGALMVYEAKFNAELLATLLSIPPNKTLLRRHLNTHFKQLVGGEIIQQKREMEGDSSFSPLTPNSKLKVSKKNQFSLMRKRSKSEMDLEDFVCPMDIQGPNRNQLGSRSLSAGQLREPSPYENTTGPVEQEVDEQTAQEIGAVSKEISCLTDMLHDEKLFASMATTNV